MSFGQGVSIGGGWLRESVGVASRRPLAEGGEVGVRMLPRHSRQVGGNESGADRNADLQGSSTANPLMETTRATRWGSWRGVV